MIITHATIMYNFFDSVLEVKIFFNRFVNSFSIKKNLTLTRHFYIDIWKNLILNNETILRKLRNIQIFDAVKF